MDSSIRPRDNADFIAEAALQPDAIKCAGAGNARGFRGGITLDRDLKAMRCICRGIVTITRHRDSMYIIHCRRCRTEYGYCDDHPYFMHEYANRGIGEPVIIPAFKPPSEKKPAPKTHACKTCHASITKEQALKTFEELGRALCEQCGK